MKINVRGIRFRLTSWYMLALAIILAAFGITIYFSLSHALRRNIDASIQSQAEWIAGVLDMMDEGLDFGEFIEDLSEHTSERKGELYIQVRQIVLNLLELLLKQPEIDISKVKLKMSLFH